MTRMRSTQPALELPIRCSLAHRTFCSVSDQAVRHRYNTPSWIDALFCGLQVLKQFLVGINGGGPGTRSQYAFDNLNIPAVRTLPIASCLSWLT